MEGFLKTRVPLSLIRPSGQNPREDFGDIDALAASITATGGEPINPPVLVMDGAYYRIVDGERRYRALTSLYGQERGRTVAALVTESMSDANELVAMLATDDKRPLTEAERAHGVQQMLLLGVDEDRAAAAAHAPVAQVRAVRRLRRRAPEGTQLTLDQYAAAAEFEDEKDQDAVLAAGERYLQEAAVIRARNDRAAARERDLAALSAHGVPVVEEKPDGMRVRGWEVFGALSDWEDADWEERDPAAVCDHGTGWRLLVAADEDEDAVLAEERARLEAEAAHEREVAAGIADAFAAFALKGVFMPAGDAAARRLAVADRTVPFAVSGTFGDEADAAIEEQRTSLRVSDWELRLSLLRVAAKCSDGVRRGDSWRGAKPSQWADAIALFADLGLDASALDEDAAGFCERVVGEAIAGGGDGEAE